MHRHRKVYQDPARSETRACRQAPCAGTGRSHVCLQRRELQTVSGSQRRHADDERTREGGPFHRTCEVADKAEGPAAEAREGRERAKGNSPERNALRTQGRESTPSALERLRQARWFPPARVGHRYPLVRLGVFTHGGSPVTPLGRFCGGGHARSWSLLRLSLIFRRGSTDGGGKVVTKCTDSTRRSG